jgi:hypothetical protein
MSQLLLLGVAMSNTTAVLLLLLLLHQWHVLCFQLKYSHLSPCTQAKSRNQHRLGTGVH